MLSKMPKFLFSCLLLLPLISIAQGILNFPGYIINTAANLGIENATVENLRTNEVVLTDEQGRFFLRGSLLPTDTLLVSAVGFGTSQLTWQKLSGMNMRISLIPKEIRLRELIITNNPVQTNQLISKMDIKMRAINNTQEALRMIPGLFIGQHAGGGKAEQIFLRGFDLDHGTDINISVDGMPVNMVSHAHGQGYADLHFVIPELIANVNFRKGAYYPEKGNFTTTGYVDFRTMDRLPGNSIKLEAGQFNTFRGVGMINLLGKAALQQEQSAFVAAEWIRTDGYFESPQNFKRYNLFGKYHGRLNQQHSLTVSLSTFASDWSASGQIPERAVMNKSIGYFGAVDPTEGGYTARSNVNVQLTTSLRNGGLVKNQLYYSAYDFKLFSNFTFFKADPVNGDQIRQKESRKIVGYNGSYSIAKNVGPVKITSEMGSNIRLDKTNGSELSRTIDKTIVTNPIMFGDITESNVSAYVNETITVSPKFTINTGLRYDHFFNHYKDHLDNRAGGKATAGILSPKLNFFYQPTANTQIYFTNGKGFHSNDTRVVVPQNGLSVLPAAYGSDLGIVTKIRKNLFVNVALWHLYLEQEFVYVGDEGVVEPSGKSRRFGVDLSMRYQPVSHLFFDMDLNYSRGRSIEDPRGQDYLPLAPAFTSIGGLTYKTKRHFSGSVRYRYMGDRPANSDYSIIAKGYFLSDLVLNYTRSKFEAGIAIQNVFNTRWKETQFETESRLKDERAPVSEIHFTPGTPFFLKGSLTYFF